MLCRICLESDNGEDFITPCRCSGTMKYVHRKCLLHWIRERYHTNNPFRCEICKNKFLDRPVQFPNQFWNHLKTNLNVLKANKTLLKALFYVIYVYLFYFLALSGSLDVTIHSGKVPDMDILIWKKSDTYAVVCVDGNCKCETEVHDNDNNPRWDHVCEYWKVKSTFIFSKIAFLVFDSDIDKNDDLIGKFDLKLYFSLWSILSGRPMTLKWDVPYKATINVTVKWTPNFVQLIKFFL